MRNRLFFVIAYLAVLGILTWRTPEISTHSTSRMATVESLAERGTFAIDHARYQTLDKVMVDGRFYSHQPPLMAVVGAAVYLPMYRLGLFLAPGRHFSYFLLTFILNGLTTVWGLWFFHRTLRWSGLDERLRVVLIASLACATLLLPFSVVLNSHGFCAALLSAALYYYLRGAEAHAPSVAAFWSGLAFSAAAAADHALLVFYALFGLCFVMDRGRRTQLPVFLSASAFTLLPTVLYYYAIGHSVRPFAARPELFLYPGTYWSATGAAETRLTGASWNSLPFALSYGMKMLVGLRRGFLIYNPLAWVALAGMTMKIRERGRYWRESAAVLAASAAIAGFYALSSSNYSGATYSIRWFVPFLPLWWFFGAEGFAVLAQPVPWKKRVAAALCCAAIFYAFAGALNPWPYEWRGALLPLANIRDALLPQSGRRS